MFKTILKALKKLFGDSLEYKVEELPELTGETELYDMQMYQFIKFHVRHGATKSEIAKRRYDVSRSTIYRWFSVKPELKELWDNREVVK